MSNRFVFVSRGFFLRRVINFPDAYELPASVSVKEWQVIPSTFIEIIGSMPSLDPLAVISVFFSPVSLVRICLWSQIEV